MKSHFVVLPDLPSEEQERLLELKDRLKYKILDINVKLGDKVNCNDVLATYGVFFIRTSKEVRVWSDKVRSTKNGSITRVSIHKDSRVRPGTALMKIEFCPHEMEFNGLCAFCGSDITTDLHTNNADEHNLNNNKQQHIISGQEIGGKRKIVKLTQSAIKKLRIENTNHLLSRRKLALVLDIDHTFLHATRESQAKLVYKHTEFRDSTHRFTLVGHRSPYYIKIRPGFREFLLDVAGAFDIHLYTMSMRKYAEEIVRWIEFEPSYRGLIRNLVTRDDVPSTKKLLHRLFPCDERMVVIIDDRVDVWPAAKENVIQIHKYLFWPNCDEAISSATKKKKFSLGSTQIILAAKLKLREKTKLNESDCGLRRFICNFFAELGCYRIEIECDIIYIFTHKSPDDLKLKRFSLAIKEAIDERHAANADYLYFLRNCKIKYTINAHELKRREGDRVLPCLSSVLLKIHAKYYENNDTINEDNENNENNENDTRNLLKLVKKDVFAGYIFVFSGCFPIDCAQEKTSEWRIAKEFGAKCVRTLSEDNRECVTHCIAPRIGTKKTSIARKLGIEIVHPNWLLNSSTHYMKSNPDIYRPQGYEEEEEEEEESKLKSILIGKKRKRNETETANLLFQAPKEKKVKFKDVETNSESKNNNLMDSLSQLVDDFNKNKDLICCDEKDIVIDEEEEQQKEEKEKKEKEDNFDFDDIQNDIDNAIKHIDDECGDDDDDIYDDDDDDDDLENLLNEELESLSS